MFSNKLMWVAVAVMILWGVVEVICKSRNNKKIDEMAIKDLEKSKKAERKKI